MVNGIGDRVFQVVRNLVEGTPPPTGPSPSMPGLPEPTTPSPTSFSALSGLAVNAALMLGVELGLRSTSLTESERHWVVPPALVSSQFGLYRAARALGAIQPITMRQVGGMVGKIFSFAIFTGLANIVFDQLIPQNTEAHPRRFENHSFLSREAIVHGASLVTGMVAQATLEHHFPRFIHALNAPARWALTLAEKSYALLGGTTSFVEANAGRLVAGAARWGARGLWANAITNWLMTSVYETRFFSPTNRLRHIGQIGVMEALEERDGLGRTALHSLLGRNSAMPLVYGLLTAVDSDFESYTQDVGMQAIERRHHAMRTALDRQISEITNVVFPHYTRAADNQSIKQINWQAVAAEWDRYESLVGFDYLLKNQEVGNENDFDTRTSLGAELDLFVGASEDRSPIGQNLHITEEMRIARQLIMPNGEASVLDRNGGVIYPQLSLLQRLALSGLKKHRDTYLEVIRESLHLPRNVDPKTVSEEQRASVIDVNRISDPALRANIEYLMRRTIAEGRPITVRRLLERWQEACELIRITQRDLGIIPPTE